FRASVAIRSIHRGFVPVSRDSNPGHPIETYPVPIFEFAQSNRLQSENRFQNVVLPLTKGEYPVLRGRGSVHAPLMSVINTLLTFLGHSIQSNPMLSTRARIDSSGSVSDSSYRARENRGFASLQPRPPPSPQRLSQISHADEFVRRIDQPFDGLQV